MNNLTHEEFTDACVDQYEEKADYRADINADFLQRYESTGDPLYAWYLYLLSRTADQTIPEWVMYYFENVAKGLLYSNNAPIDCARHLGFELKNGGRSSFKQGHDSELRILAVNQVNWLLSTKKGKLTVEDACKEAAKWLLYTWGKEGFTSGKKRRYG